MQASKVILDGGSKVSGAWLINLSQLLALFDCRCIRVQLPRGNHLISPQIQASKAIILEVPRDCSKVTFDPDQSLSPILWAPVPFDPPSEATILVLRLEVSFLYLIYGSGAVHHGLCTWGGSNFLSYHISWVRGYKAQWFQDINCG